MRRAIGSCLVCSILLGISGCGGEEDSSSSAPTVVRPSPPSSVPPAAGRPDLNAAGSMMGSGETAPGRRGPLGGRGRNTRRGGFGRGSGLSDEEVQLLLRHLETAFTKLDPEMRTVLQLKAISSGMMQYFQQNRRLPTTATLDEKDQPLLSWRVELLPLLGYGHLYDEFNLEEPWDSEYNKTLLEKIPIWYASAGRDDGTTNFLVPVGPGTAFESSQGTSQVLLRDGVENTILVMEVDDAGAVPWTKPADHRYVPAAPRQGLGGLRAGGFLSVWGDKQVHLIGKETSDDDLQAVFSAFGAEPVNYASIGQLAPGSADAVPQIISMLSQVMPSFSMANQLGSMTGRGRGAQGGFPGGEFGTGPPGSRGAGQDEPPASLNERAKDALRAGREREGLRLLRAAALTDDEDTAWQDMMYWVKDLKRPTLAVRWGVGIYLKDPGDLLSKSSEGGGIGIGGGARRFTGGSSRYGGGAGSSRLTSLTGEISEKVLDALQQRAEKGYFVPILGEEQADARRGAFRGRQNSYRQPGGAGNESQLEQLYPGVTMLEEADRKELIAQAQDEGLDVLMIFKVEPRPIRSSRGSRNDSSGGRSGNRSKRNSRSYGRSGKNGNKSSDFQVVKDISVELVRVPKGRKLNKDDVLFTSRKVNDLQIEHAEDNPKFDKPADILVERLMDYVDSQLKPGDLPASLGPENVMRHAKNLAAAKHPNPLSALTELRFWHAKKWITDEALAKFYVQIIGAEKGNQLANGTKEDKEAALGAWINSGIINNRKIRRLQ